MGRRSGEIDARLEEFILAQPVFFVATAPLSGQGHVNCSPKGQSGTFGVLGPRRFGYLDLTGSGAETVAHLRENGRMTVMFCAFDGPPRIVRLYGRGEAVLDSDARFEALAATFPKHIGARAVIVLEVERIADSCGYGVPRMAFESERDQLDSWSAAKGEGGLAEYRERKNAASIDGLPAFDGHGRLGKAGPDSGTVRQSEP